MSEVVWERKYYKNGQLYHEDPYVNGFNHGIEKYYYDDGQLELEIPLVNNKRHGITKWYYKNGVLREVDLWIKGRVRNDLLGDEHRLTRLVLLGEQG